MRWSCITINEQFYDVTGFRLSHAGQSPACSAGMTGMGVSRSGSIP